MADTIHSIKQVEDELWIMEQKIQKMRSYLAKQKEKQQKK